MTTKARGRDERPDHALFANADQKLAAYSEQNNESVFYQQVLAIAEAKYWERPLSQVSSNDQRDIYKNTNPSFQIASYLIGTGANWGILTNGREWLCSIHANKFGMSILPGAKKEQQSWD